MKSASKALAISNHLIAQHERNQREAALNTFLDQMRAKGASQQSIQTAHTGFSEYLRITSAPSPRRTSPEAQPDQPSSDPVTQDTTLPLSEIPTQDTALPLSEIPTQPLTWLWPQRIPIGKLTLLDGEPGSGTSLLALTIAACISSGQPLPAADTGTATTTTTTSPRNVLLIAPRDHASDTIKPRLQAAGGDPSHLFMLNSVETVTATPPVSFTDRPFSLAHALDLLEATIKRLHAVLVIIDPLHAVLGRSRTRSSSSPVQSTHTLLASLDQLAQSTGCAFLLVRPVRTGRSDLRRPRPTGSLDQASVARSGLLVTCDPEDEDTRLLLPTKHSLCQLPAVLSYEIVEHTSGAPVILWLGIWQDSQSPASTLSAQRQAILAYLQQLTLPSTASSLATDIGYGYERVRKMLQRMLKEGKLVSPARGLYTTPGNPCLGEEYRIFYGQHEESGQDFLPTSTYEASSPGTVSSTNAAPD